MMVLAFAKFKNIFYILTKQFSDIFFASRQMH